MPIGPSSRPNEPLRVGLMLLGLVLAAALGGASGVIWQWLAGDDAPVAEDAPSAEPDEADSAAPAKTISPPRPSPGGG